MSDENPSLQDIWKRLGLMNRRFDGLERQMVELKSHVAEQIGDLRAQMVTGFGALRSMIEARDFRLDEHGRRISELESSRS